MSTANKQWPSLRGADERDRRRAPRYAACVPVMFEPSAGVERLGVVRDVSLTGGVLMTQRPLPVGDTIRLELHLSKDESRVQLTNARVVRLQRRTTRNSYWLYDAAVEFEHPLVEAEGEVRMLSDKQRRLGLHPGK